METIEGNNLIAEFMGHLNEKERVSYDLNQVVDMPIWLTSYHSSWDWLMPVVEKIENLQTPEYYRFVFKQAATICHIYAYAINKQPATIYSTAWGDTDKTKIQETWQAIVSFITWYNTQKQ